MSLKEQIIHGMRVLDEDLVLDSAVEAIKKNVDRLSIIEWLNLGVAEVGKLYESEEYYIIELIMAEIIYKKVLDLEDFDIWASTEKENPIGTIVLGTVEGDNHDIGKNIFKSIAEANGFRVYDLGVDVAPDAFVEKIQEIHPDILALSGILTYVVGEIKSLIDRLKRENLRNNLHIIVGGPALSDKASEYVGADCVVHDANEGAEICRQWLKGTEN